MVSTVLKVVIAGNSGVGKTALILRFTEEQFSSKLINTIGVECRSKKIALQNNKEVKLQLWDTAGQERFRTITASYYRGAHALVLVYDATERKSYEQVLT